MTTITYQNHSYHCDTGETVLECLLRHGVAVPHGCRSGVCQSCMMRVVTGVAPSVAQQGLKSTLQQQGYVLSCQLVPQADIGVAPADNALPVIEAEVVDKTPLNDVITRLRLRIDSPFDYRAGQFLNLHHDDLVRSYSIASLPHEGVVELHIERIANGKVSGWIHDDLTVGDTVHIDGPHGSCYYLDDNSQQPLLLIGTGSGLAPLWGIARDALHHHHQGEIHLFHGSSTADRLYLSDELHALVHRHDNFFYTPCVSGANPPPSAAAGRANDIALAKSPKLNGWRVFLCGHPRMVENTKKQAFLAGASLQDIFSDPFLPAAD